MMPTAKSPLVSNFDVMRVLFTKDWRLFRAPLVALIVVGAGCYLIALADILYPHTDNNALITLFGASVIALELTGLLASAFGGVAIAGERADRTADFIGLLPVTRMQIMLSKLIVSLVMIGACAAFHLLIVGLIVVTRPYIYPGSNGQHDLPWTNACFPWVGITMSLFGIAWLLSTFLRSGPISACVSIAATTALSLVLALLLNASHSNEQELALRIAPIPLAIGLASLIGGAIYYVRRVAP